MSRDYNVGEFVLFSMTQISLHKKIKA